MPVRLLRVVVVVGALAGCTGDTAETTSSSATPAPVTSVSIDPRIGVGDAQSDGGSVVIAAADTAVPGFVAVVAAGADLAAGPPLGVSALLGGPQQHSGIVVPLAAPLAPQATPYALEAVLYADDGDGVWSAQDEVVLRSDRFGLTVG